MKFKANNLPENMQNAAFEDDLIIQSDVEDVIHRRCMLLQVNIRSEQQVGNRYVLRLRVYLVFVTMCFLLFPCSNLIYMQKRGRLVILT